MPKPIVLPADVRRDGAPGPNNLPSPSCSIGTVANPFATAADPYYNGNTGAWVANPGEFRLDLTPTQSYTCKATSSVYGPGELSWNNTTKELKVRGVVYIPANATVSQDLYYTTFDAGSPRAGATIYVAGSFTYDRNICALRVGTTVACNTAAWDPNVHSELAIVAPNLPAGGSRAAQTGSSATNPSHTVTGSNNAQYQGFIYTDGLFTRSGGNGFVSGSVFAANISMQGGAATAPAPGAFRLPRGVQGQPRVETTTTTTTQTSTTTTAHVYTTTGTSTIYVPTTVSTTIDAPYPTTPRDFGG